MLVWVLIEKDCIQYEGCDTEVIGVYDEYDKANQAKRDYESPSRRRGYGSVSYDIETFELNG